MNIVDDSYKTLREEGYEGSKSDLVYKKLKDLTGLSSSTPDMWYQWLRSLGYNGSVNDMLNQHLAGKGYGSSLQDALARSFSNRDLYYANEGMTALFDIQRYINVGVATNFEGLFDITRASSKYVYGTGAQTGQLVEVPAGQPAYDHDPVTGAPLGLSVEGSATNFNTYSETFDNSVWTADDSTVTPIDDYYKLVPSTASVTTHRLRTTNLLGLTDTSAVHTSWWVVEPDGYNFVKVRLGSGAASFDLSDGSFIGQISTSGYGIEPIAGGKYLVWIATNASLGFNARPYIYACDTEANINANALDTLAYAGDGTSGIRVYRSQTEQGTKPTSYIPTVASTVTRAADIVTSDAATFGDWFNASEGTFVVEWDDDGFVPANNTSPPTILSLDNGDSSAGTGNFVALQKRSNGFYNLVIRNTSGSFISVSTGVPISSGNRSGVISFDGTNAKASVDGSAAVTAASYRGGFTQSSLGKLADLNVFGSVVFENLSFQPEATL